MFRRKRQSLKNLLRKANVDIDLNSKFGQKMLELFAEAGFEFDNSVYVDTSRYDSSVRSGIRFGEILSANNHNLVTIYWDDTYPRRLQVYHPGKGWSQIDYENGD